LQTNELIHKSSLSLIKDKLRVYAAFGKLRLASLVVFSSVLGYMMAASSVIWPEMIALIFGGFLVTASSNGFNQVIERELDKLMDRTKNRPIPVGSMNSREGLIVASVMGIIGLYLLFIFTNTLAGILGAFALFLYVVIYTPLKRVTPFAVLVGAFPGAIPPMLGYIAATGSFGLAPGILFAVQFIWQFPHFWAIAWKAHDDYQKAGFHLLPSPGGRDFSSAVQIATYSLFLIPVSCLPYIFGLSGVISLIVCLIAGLIFFYYSLRLLKTLDLKDATRLMFASFIYLPIVQISFLF